jgi:hypothetical protein
MHDILPRQIWTDPVLSAQCKRYQLPFAGEIYSYNNSYANVTCQVDADSLYVPFCSSAPNPSINLNDSIPLRLGDPFVASTVPQIFVLGATLVIAWSLVIILLITPRTSFVLGTGLNRLGRSVLSNSGSPTVISVGGRPWLQKWAAFTVGISLFLATLRSFDAIELQYELGYENAQDITDQIANSTEIKIVRVISTTSLWLAQVQTLIRLFPRHREKVLIKWVGFGLIILDTIFAVLNGWSQTGNSTPSPRKYTEAVPALAYLFELALSLLYAAWVVYYSFVKRRYAFYHPKMGNICVVALLSYASIAIPVIFFVMDISKPELASWGDYVRWVGAAAASVVVWEWVERIEALEREERKDGILGREIFDGDDMLRRSPGTDFRWPRSRLFSKGRTGTSGGWSSSRSNIRDSTSQPTRTRSSGQSSDIPLENIREHSTATSTTLHRNSDPRARRNPQVSPPPITESPVSRSDTTSANSTIYAVVHHPVSTSASPAQPDTGLEPITSTTPLAPEQTLPKTQSRVNQSDAADAIDSDLTTDNQQSRTNRFVSVANPFKRRRQSPPPEVSRSAVDASGRPSAARWNSGRSSRNFLRLRRHVQVPATELPIIVVPAQPNGSVWSPSPDIIFDNTDEIGHETTSQNVSFSIPQMRPSSNRNSPNHSSSTSDSSSQRPYQHSPSQNSHTGGDHLTVNMAGSYHSSERGTSPLSILPSLQEHVETASTSSQIPADQNNSIFNGPRLPPSG